MLIDNTYFQGSGLFNVPNIDRENPVEEGNYNQLTAFIKVYEPEICRRVIGKTLYDALITGLAAASPEQRWIDLRDKLIDSVNLKSPISNYVWFRMWQQGQRQSTTAGDVTLNSPGMTVDGNIQLSCLVWNEMAQMFADFKDWFILHESDYVEWTGELGSFDRLNIYGI